MEINDCKRADKIPRKFTPLYDTPRGPEAKLKPHPAMIKTRTSVPRANIIVTGDISPSPAYMIDQRMLDYLSAKGYIVSPIFFPHGDATTVMPAVVSSLPPMHFPTGYHSPDPTGVHSDPPHPDPTCWELTLCRILGVLLSIISALPLQDAMPRHE